MKSSASCDWRWCRMCVLADMGQSPTRMWSKYRVRHWNICICVCGPLCSRRLLNDSSCLVAGWVGEQHWAERARRSGLCGAGEGQNPKMQKVEKDKQTGEMQHAHSLQTDSHVIISLPPPPLSFLSLFSPHLYPLLLLLPPLVPSFFHLSACLPLTSPRGKW